VQILEPFLVLSAIAWLLVSLRATPPDRLSRVLPALTWLVLAAHVLLEVPRWPMIPAYAVVVLLTLATRWLGGRGAVVRTLVVGAGVLLLGSATLLATQFPVIDLPPPTGPHAVGRASFTLVDPSRPEALAPESGLTRAVFVDVWYPAVPPTGDGPRPTTLWPELHAGRWDRVRFFTDYLRAVETHGYRDLRIDAGGGPYPVLLFNHGLQMFTAQSTLLMEHLASHGYAVFSIGHPWESLRVNLEDRGTVIPEFIASREGFAKATKWVEEANRHILAAVEDARREGSPERRAEIMLEAVEASPDLNQRVEVWVEDTRFVLERIAEGANELSSLRPALDLDRVGVLGMSLGGATASEFCKADPRCSAGVNVDGLQYGTRQRVPLRVPFLMIASDDGAGLNEFLRLGSDAVYLDCHVAGTRHPDFTDLPLVWPWLRHVGQLGRVPPATVETFLDATVLGFLDRYVAGRRDPVRVPEGCSMSGE